MASLFVIQGDDQGRRFELARDTTSIGRDRGNEIVLHDTEISRRHAEIRRTEQGFMLFDLQSSNGCFVNQTRQTDCELHHGDRLQLGHTLMIFTHTASAPATRPISVSLQESHREGSRIIHSIRHEEGSQIFFPTELREPGESQNLQDNLQLIYDTALAVSRTLDIDQLLDYLLGLIFDWVDADRACIVLIDTHTKRPEAKAQRVRVSRPGVDESITISRTILDYVLTNSEGVLTSDAQDDQRWSPEGSIINAGVNEAICVPMQGRYGVVGAIYIDTYIPPDMTSSATRSRFTEDHLKLMIAIAHQAALAVEDTHYYSAVVRSERLAAMGQAVAAISHHVKNILQGIQGGSYIIEEGIKSERIDVVKHGWGIVSRNQDRIAHLVMDMLSFSKEREPDRSNASLNDVVEDVVNLMRARAKENGVTLEFRPDIDLPMGLFDEEGIHRAALNVLTNAIDAVQEAESPRVIVSTEFRLADQMLIATVEDNGTGISPENIERIFSAFESTKGNRGTGLGLPVSQKVLQEHGGDVIVESELGRGTKFTLYLPWIGIPTQDTQY
ncbi:FHA domain-containing protein [Bremerella cremea]|uniref:histidine kinase n=1 Tax=Bremerella cremea TaxID=1031537 RepID=A0A368KY16_9BACT|nr:ATP-binding protein [Bremerella cremea]RCS54595.1 FHA domain-containing protein [Bremerella cremea]